ncbi:MAG: hypothetical protein WAN50_00105, partial [Minisyncoccia bacterium]
MGHYVRRANGLKPDIRVEVATPRLAYDMADRSDILVIDAPGWTDRESLKMASWSTFCVIPSRANRIDDLSETVRLLHALKGQGIEDWRFGVALNALRAATAQQDDADARAYLAEVGFKALPGFVRDLKAYEVALLEGKAITETGEKELNNGIRCGGITFKIGFFRARVWAEAGTEDERLCKVTGIGTVSYGR